MAPSRGIKAVLTGDLVGSRQLDARTVESAMDRLRDAADVVGQLAECRTHFTRFRGDGWQIFLDVPGLVLTACVYMTARLRSADLNVETRIAAGLGSVDAMPADSLEAARGDAFTISGHLLDQMPRHQRLALYGSRNVSGDLVTDFHTAIFALVEVQIGRWSAPQAEAVALALDPEWLTQADVAARLGISRQAAQKRLSGAGFGALRLAMHAFESHDWERPT
jgi:hypothetical protein